MNFIEEFKKRGFLHQCTNEDDLSKQVNLTAYIGFDCTAKSLHIGSLIQIMIIRLLKKHGHTPIILLGGQTTRIGDPSGKDKARPILSKESIKENLQGIRSIISKFIDSPTILNNQDWLSNINYIDLLEEFGRKFSINKMLTFDCIKNRLENKQGLSFLEFNYMLLQSYDFHYLNKNYNCNLQIGGSDQWGNITSGVDLIRRSGKLAFGLTTPLMTTCDGKKMGKTESNPIWLDGCPFKYFQYFRNIHDDDVVRFLKLFTEFDLNEIDRLSKLKGSDINQAKIILAQETTRIAFGEDGLGYALNETKKKYG